MTFKDLKTGAAFFGADLIREGNKVIFVWKDQGLTISIEENADMETVTMLMSFIKGVVMAIPECVNAEKNNV